MVTPIIEGKGILTATASLISSFSNELNDGTLSQAIIFSATHKLCSQMKVILKGNLKMTEILGNLKARSTLKQVFYNNPG